MTRAFLLAVVLVLMSASSASALQSRTVTLDGPGAHVLDVGGVAMAADGTGGVVYRAFADGRPHIFVAPFLDGRWLPPQRVDAGQAFESSWPRIAAARGGRLLVAWVQETGRDRDTLYTAQLPPGQRRFTRPVAIDTNVGEATATNPSVALSDRGTGYAGYVVMRGLHPGGKVAASLRVARLDGGRWRRYAPINRDLEAPLSPPRADTAPRVAVDADGVGLVAWQEPDGTGVERLWTRRLYPYEVQAHQAVSTFNSPVDGFALDMAPSGAAVAVWRQTPGATRALPSTRLMAATLPPVAAAGNARWTEPELADGAGAGAALPAEPTALSASIADDGEWRAGFGLGNTAWWSAGADAVRLGDAGAVTPGAPAVAAGPDGQAAAVYGQEAESGSVAVVERLRGGRELRGLGAARFAGVVSDVRGAGSGLGDGLFAFRQGDGDSSQVAALSIDAPPAPFELAGEDTVLRPGAADIRWTAARDAFGSVRYRVVLDGQVIARSVGDTSLRLPGAGLEDGTYRVQVVATDRNGQEVAAPARRVVVDGTAPRATLSAGGRVLRLQLRDGTRATTAGLDADASSVRWGDGAKSAGAAKLEHRYSRPGRYVVRVRAVDRAGNARTVTRKVTIR